MSFHDIRPNIEPMPFAHALADVDVIRWIDTDKAATEVPVCGVTVSSRDCEPGWIFIAIPGMKRHGITFAAGAIRQGASAVVTDEEGAALCNEYGINVPVAVVANPRQASALVAARVHGFPARALTTMAITGTNGKTTTSYMMRAALQAIHPNPALTGTNETLIRDVRFRSDQTTAEAPAIQRLLAQAVEWDLGAAVIETSSHALSLNRVDGIQFDVVGFTNLQHDHLDFHHTMDEYLEAKAVLFTPEHAKRGVVCVDDEWGQRLAENATIPVQTVAALSDHEADWAVTSTRPDMESGRLFFTLRDPQGVEHLVPMPILGEVNVQNTAVAIVCAAQLGIPMDQIIHAVDNAEQVPYRMQKMNPTPQGQPLVIVDYAHTPEALEWTLRSTRSITPGKLFIVFGSDGDRDPIKRPILGRIAATEADVLFVTDENPRTEDAQSIRNAVLAGVREVRPDLHDVTEVITCRRDALRRAILTAQAGDTVIITGKGPEWYQDIGGIKHEYNDVPVSREVLSQDPRTQM